MVRTPAACRECHAEKGAGGCADSYVVGQRQKHLCQPADSPFDLLLLECVVDPPTQTEVAVGDAGLQWRRVQDAGLGPFLFLCARRVPSAMMEEGRESFVALRPVGMPWPPILWGLIASSCLERRLYPSPQLQCVERERWSLREVDRDAQLGDRGEKFVTGPTLLVGEHGVVTMLSGSLSHSDEEGGEEKLMVCTDENMSMLLSVLRETAAWSAALLQCCGVPNGNISGCPEGSEVRRWQPKRIELAIQAVHYLQQAMARQHDDKTFDLMELLIGWARLMYGNLVAAPSFPLQRHHHHHHQQQQQQKQAGCMAELSAASDKVAEVEADTSRENKVSCERCLSSSPFLETHPLESSSTLSAGNNLRASSSGDVRENSRLTPLLTQQSSGSSTMQKKEYVDGEDKSPPPLMSICSDVLVEAFLLQRGRRRGAPHAEHSANSGDAENDNKEEEGGASSSSFLMTAAAATAAGATCGDGNIFPDATKASLDVSQEADPHVTYGDNVCGDGSQSFLPSLAHRLLVARELAPDGEFVHHLSAIAKGDMFPSRKMMEQADLLRGLVCDTITVRFYDLDPHHLLGLSESLTAHPAPSVPTAVSGAGAHTGHPCYLYITQTDIILASAFDGIHTRNRSSSAPQRQPASNGINTASLHTTRDTDGSTGHRGSNNMESSLGDRPGHLKLRLVIPRVSLMDVRVLFSGDGAVAPAVRLQTRSCRRVWLVFHREAAMRAVYSELITGIKPFYGNRFLASAQRPWRMAALALVAGDVLPTPHTPFYRQVLQNLLVAFADLEARRRGTTVTKAEGQEHQQQEKQQTSCGWWMYSPAEECVRQGIPTRQWRMSDVNCNYNHFPTYPARFVVPNSLSDNMLTNSAKLRARGRVEALSFYYSPTGAGIVRAAQPAAVHSLRASSSNVDAIDAYRRACGMRLHILDLRSTICAVGNTFVGGGFTICEDRRFCSLANIHEVRHAYDTLCSDILDGNPTFFSVMKAAGATVGPMRNSTTVPTMSPRASSSSSSQQQQQRQQLKDSDTTAWVTHIRMLLRTAENAARLVAGISVEEALPPAATDAAAATTAPGEVTSDLIAREEGGSSGIGSSGSNGGGDRLLQRSSTLYVWTRAFHAIPFPGAGVDGVAPPVVQPPPASYGPLRNRKTARLVVVNCSDGWDRTPQVCALAELLLDPYYRTVEGFLTLLDKDFVSFGHPMFMRSSTLLCLTDTKSGVDGCDGSDPPPDESGSTQPLRGNPQSAPIILQFLDAVHQLLRLYPHCFEFTETFLLLVVDILHTGIVGTFAVNCEKDVTELGVDQQTLSLSQFFAVILATTIPTGSRHNWPEAEAVEALGCVGDRNDDDDPGDALTGSGVAPPVMSLQSFFQAFSGGPALRSIGWCTSPGTKQRRLSISQDAMCHSGLLNPHFSLADNKLLGPLVDSLRQAHLVLWGGFFFRYNFWCERPPQLQQFSEQSRSTFYATVVAALKAATVSSSASTSLLSLQGVEQEKQRLQQQEKMRKPMDRRLRMKASGIFLDPNGMTDTPPPNVPRLDARMGITATMKHTTTEIGRSVYSLHVQPTPKGLTVGSVSGRLCPGRLLRPASYAAMPGNSSPVCNSHHSLHADDVATGAISFGGDLSGFPCCSGSATGDPIGCVQQRKPTPTKITMGRARGYNTLLDELDHAFDL